MKKALLLASVAAISLQATAQQPKIPFFGKVKSKHGQLTKQLLRLQESGIKAEKPTADKQRVIAQAFKIPAFGGEPQEYDSTRYTYTGTNGSTFDFNSGDYMYIDYFTNTYPPMFVRLYEATSQNVLADSMLYYDDDGFYGSQKAYYRTDKKIDSVWTLSSTGTGVRNKTINAYDAGGHLTASYELNRSSATAPWDTSSYRHYSYNSTFTQMSHDSLWVKVMTNIALREDNIYHYSAAGKLDSIMTWNTEEPTPVRKKAVRIGYNSGGKITTIKEYRYDDLTGIPALSEADSLGYTTGVNYYTFHGMYGYNDETMVDGSEEVRYFNSTSGLLDSVQNFSFIEGAPAPWMLFGTMYASYNSFNNPTGLKVTVPAIGIDITMNFYYEIYDDNVSSVRPVTANQDFSVYPNPFANTINIDWKGRQQSDATVRLVNMVGQEVFQGKISLKSGRNQLDIPAVTNGNYVLLIQDAAGKSWSAKMVKR